ncbi:MAG: hypothetical protein ACXWJG_17910, partial [Caldimonas sp.]
ALKAMPLAGNQSIVHSMSVHPFGSDIAVQQKTAYTVFEAVRIGAPAKVRFATASIVSSTSFIGGFNPRQQCLGFFSGQRARLAAKRRRRAHV